MNVVCLDLEGVLIPEIWINFAEAVKIDELKLTTRDISDYDVLMKKRIGILRDNGLKLKDIQAVIEKMNVLDGAREFADELRSKTQLIILSDTFTQFAAPFMKKLGWPTIFCNTLIIDGDGAIADYKLRQQDGKRHAVNALKSIGYDVFAAGDSYNDVTMIQNSKFGAFFCPPDNIIEEFPKYPVAKNYADLMAEIDKFLAK